MTVPSSFIMKLIFFAFYSENYTSLSKNLRKQKINAMLKNNRKPGNELKINIT